jgi:uncharacterized protein
MAIDPLLILSDVECLQLLARVHFGRVGFVVDGEPIVLPVNYAFDSGTVLFRSTAGSKLDAAQAGARMAFEIDATDPLYQGGWSVLVRGPAAVVTDPEELARLEAVHLRPWWPGSWDRWIRIVPEVISGRRLRSE